MRSGAVICVGCGMPMQASHDSDPICAECLTLPGARRMLGARTPPRTSAGASNGVADTAPPRRVGDVLPLVELRRLAEELVGAIARNDLSETDRLIRDLVDDWSALDGARRSEANRRFLTGRAA